MSCHIHLVKPRELSDWVAQIWPQPREDRKIADQVIRRATPLLSAYLCRKFAHLDPVIFRSHVSLGAWTAMSTFDPAKGSYFWHASRSALSMCTNAAIEPRVPLIWHGTSARRQGLGLTAPHVEGWADRERAGESSLRVVDYSTTHLSAMDIDPFQALDIAERVEQLDQDLRFIRLDIRPAWRRSILEGLNSPELAAEIGVIRQRVVDIEQEWRRILGRPIVDQVEWLAQRAQEARKRHRLGAHWIDIEADYRATAAALRAKHDIPGVTYGPPPATRQALKQRITEAVRLHQLGRSNFEIARELRVSPYGVSRLLDSKAGKLLMCR